MNRRTRAVRIERTRMRMPPGFDTRKLADERVQAVLSERIARNFGEGWRIDGANADGTLNVVREVEISDVASITVPLATGIKPSDGDKTQAKLESDYPDYTMTAFNPYARSATLTRLAAEEVRARGLVAEALQVKPWDVQVTSRPDGGFDFQLRSYVPSKHDARIREVATATLGRPGWYFRVDVQNTVLSIIPGELPTFPAAYPYPFDGPVDDVFRVPIGVALGGDGSPNLPLDLNLADSAGAILQGLAGSGKSVLVNAFVYGVLARGHELVVLDVPHKAVDFEWCRPFVREHGWGCESKAAAVTAARLVYEEGIRRGEVLRQMGAQKWQDLPADVRAEMPIITVVADELTGLLAFDPIPKALPKDHPVRVEAAQAAAETELLKAVVTKIPAEMRAAGIRLVLATQQAQSNTGIPPTVKHNLPNRVLLGVNATKQARGHAFANPDSVPWVPEHIAADAGAGRGSGVAEFEGQPSTVFKAFFAPTSQYERHLLTLGLPRAVSPEPTAAQIARHVPRLDEDMGDDRPASRLESEGGWGERDGRDASEVRLRGAAAAAHQLAVDAAQHARAAR
ncbi:hypothetical protein CHO01_39440 [Cellulomonas hominis]|uniref:FtsK domain-containing protein n=1 Tax=Cellulomonas hominis TaxID=156981 RepID=A0A511FLV2_9CELL|nr:cell division protein FtsK [Cellulomonas hominis]MBB5474642.1 hypothetical protein [Cellulomonas hominis]NKY06000.1 cell division protein FtsK [Cellulomonas hominis]GEL48828.1 hypothetical protein CHO01_39440 [Cellulomonas hominis]